MIGELGGVLLDNLESPCSHFLFQGIKDDDLHQELSLAKTLNCRIVSPFWIQNVGLPLNSFLIGRALMQVLSLMK